MTAREKLRLCSVDCDERKTTPSEAVLLKQFNPKALRLRGSVDCLSASQNIITIGQNLVRDASEQERLEGREGTTRRRHDI